MKNATKPAKSKTVKALPAQRSSAAAKRTGKPASAKPANRAARKTAVAAKPTAARSTPVQRTGRSASRPVAADVIAAVPTPRPKRRPLIATIRKNDGRPLSYSERLGEAMHRRFGHAGPVCHTCRTNASRLASLGPAPSPIAI